MQPDAVQARNKPFECRVILLGALSFLEEEVPMLFNERFFRKNKFNVVNVRAVFSEAINTFERRTG
jgi:hypothetical protein